jgi:hypothetical protein
MKWVSKFAPEACFSMRGTADEQDNLALALALSAAAPISSKPCHLTAQPAPALYSDTEDRCTGTALTAMSSQSRDFDLFSLVHLLFATEKHLPRHCRRSQNDAVLARRERGMTFLFRGSD